MKRGPKSLVKLERHNSVQNQNNLTDAIDEPDHRFN